MQSKCNFTCLELDETNAQQQLDSTRGPRRMAGRSGEAECGAGNAVHILTRFIRDRRGRELLSEKDWRYLAVFIWSLWKPPKQRPVRSSFRIRRRRARSSRSNGTMARAAPSAKSFETEIVDLPVVACDDFGAFDLSGLGLGAQVCSRPAAANRQRQSNLGNGFKI